jgi:DNA (cytosine-5)-methyltransferase 1
MFRVIKEARPRFVLAENVAGLINMALDDVLSQLESEGYTTGAVVLPACSLNAPHRRDRVWIMARDANIGNVREKRGVSEGNKGSNPSGVCEDVAHPSGKRLQGGERKGAAGEKGASSRHSPKCGGDVADSSGKRQPGQGASGDASNPKAHEEGKATQPGDGCFPYQWSTEPNVGRVAHGIPSRTHRLKALGNAIVPQVAYEILKLTTETTQQKENK